MTMLTTQMAVGDGHQGARFAIVDKGGLVRTRLDDGVLHDAPLLLVSRARCDEGMGNRP